jgi:hypothetical protein
MPRHAVTHHAGDDCECLIEWNLHYRISRRRRRAVS